MDLATAGSSTKNGTSKFALSEKIRLKILTKMCLKWSQLGQFWSDFDNFWSECVSLAIVYENISFGIKKVKFGPILTKIQKSNPARLCLTFCDHRAVLGLFKQVRLTKITI